MAGADRAVNTFKFAPGDIVKSRQDLLDAYTESSVVVAVGPKVEGSYWVVLQHPSGSITQELAGELTLFARPTADDYTDFLQTHL